MNWALKGDKNTRYFHIMAFSKNSRNSLCSIAVNGSMTEEPIGIKTEVKAHFLQHFSES